MVLPVLIYSSLVPPYLFWLSFQPLLYFLNDYPYPFCFYAVHSLNTTAVLSGKCFPGHIISHEPYQYVQVIPYCCNISFIFLSFTRVIIVIIFSDFSDSLSFFILFPVHFIHVLYLKNARITDSCPLHLDTYPIQLEHYYPNQLLFSVPLYPIKKQLADDRGFKYSHRERTKKTKKRTYKLFVVVNEIVVTSVEDIQM